MDKAISHPDNIIPGDFGIPATYHWAEAGRSFADNFDAFNQRQSEHTVVIKIGA